MGARQAKAPIRFRTIGSSAVRLQCRLRTSGETVLVQSFPTHDALQPVHSGFLILSRGICGLVPLSRKRLSSACYRAVFSILVLSSSRIVGSPRLAQPSRHCYFGCGDRLARGGSFRWCAGGHHGARCGFSFAAARVRSGRSVGAGGDPAGRHSVGLPHQQRSRSDGRFGGDLLLGQWLSCETHRVCLSHGRSKHPSQVRPRMVAYRVSCAQLVCCQRLIGTP